MSVNSTPSTAGPRVSFEFFPPGSAAMEETLWRSIAHLSPLQPRFVSVTYGADGSTRERTHNVIKRLAQDTALIPVPHLTCVGASRAEIDDIASQYWDEGVRHIVALRGDPPKDAKNYQAHPDGYAYASDLVAGLKRIADFDVTVAAYPEVHPEASSAQFDIDNLKRKCDAGADRAITQFFFRNDVFLRFHDDVRAAGINIDIVPGILPITKFPQLARFATACGASVPDWLTERFKDLEDDPVTRQMLAASTAIEQVSELVNAGFNDFHFYTLNRSELTYAICHSLGLRPVVEKSEAKA